MVSNARALHQKYLYMYGHLNNLGKDMATEHSELFSPRQARDQEQFIPARLLRHSMTKMY